MKRDYNIFLMKGEDKQNAFDERLNLFHKISLFWFMHLVKYNSVVKCKLANY